ncbi:hypothetical protein [Streptomyces sp. CB00455]|uniref:hypothetical protein n=1 Tax=Streptomyces sp. CB00455 TaxID=1703927 RepID=UPI000AA01A03|nr:hypothetical protein [Streptomyces sp. CB00455]
MSSALSSSAASCSWRSFGGAAVRFVLGLGLRRGLKGIHDVWPNRWHRQQSAIVTEHGFLALAPQYTALRLKRMSRSAVVVTGRAT